MPIVRRVGLGRNLTQAEVDGNFDTLEAVDLTKAPKLLTDLVLDNATDVTAADEVTPAIGKLQAKWNAFAGNVRATVLTGLSTASATVVTAADSVLVAIGKLQAQASAAIGTWAALTDKTTADLTVNTGLVSALAAKAANLLTGLSTADATDVVATDAVTIAFGKLQAKWNAFATSVRAVVLTGLSTATATAVTAADSVLIAIGKLQAQISANLGTWVSLTDKITANLMVNTGLTDALATKATLMAEVTQNTSVAMTAAGFASRQIRCNNATPITLTINNDATGGWAGSDAVSIFQLGAGTVTLAAGTATLDVPTGTIVVTSGVGSYIECERIAANRFAATAKSASAGGGTTVLLDGADGGTPSTVYTLPSIDGGAL